MNKKAVKAKPARRIIRRLPAIKPASVALHIAVVACMVLLNFTLPRREPLSFALFYAAVLSGLDPLVLGAGYLLSSVASLSAYATLSYALQATLVVLVAVIYRRLRKKIGIEGAFLAAAAQIPFIFLFPHDGYAFLAFSPVLQKAVISAFLFLFSLLFESGLDALLSRAFRCRLSAGALAELSLMWICLGLGLVGAFGGTAFSAIVILLLLSLTSLLKSPAAVVFTIVLSAPLALATLSVVPIAEFAVYACLALLLCPYGRGASALAAGLGYLAAQYFYGLYETSWVNVALTLLAFALPALLSVCIPEKVYRKFKRNLLFYRERTLPRIAVNRNRRAVGERLYEVSALFREIECAFEAGERENISQTEIRNKLTNTLCALCPNRRKCAGSDVQESLDKLIAVGCAKGRVNLIDLPADISAVCSNSAGLLFALNKQLAEYRRVYEEMESARAGRHMLAEQARGVSEILKDLALEQSEEFAFSDEEETLSRALAAEGILSSELFLYGEGDRFTVSMTLLQDTETKKLCQIASDALGVPLTLSEKLPLTGNSFAYIFRRKANFDAAFGIASTPKTGEFASGDTHSLMKIDERRFLVALSDGMGSGSDARAVSDNALSLIESFYKAKMPSETILSTFNRLIAYSAEEMFACLDLAAVNLDTGCADIVKIGSPAGFILSGEELRVLEGESLPIGMLEAVHPATMRVNMKENDFLIFMSDGVSGAYGSTSELCAYLSTLRPLNPQSLAEEILADALKRYGNLAADDMTVLTVKLNKECA
ncbi:MAG: SpoIIE family protein phosphatase [Clostridiales bacterium]|nr:SpoIIE family protein phosphatase [Clostridiales bacterium]